MPDRHGPLRVVYQNRGVSGDRWQTFENETPDDVLDRTTRGILQTDPEWLADALTQREIEAVEEAFGVSIGKPDDGGEIEDPTKRFDWSGFDASFSTFETRTFPVFEATVTDADGDDDLTKIRISAESADGQRGTDVRNADGKTSELQFFESAPFQEPVSRPVTATLSASDTDSNEEFVDLVTREFVGEIEPRPLVLPLDETTKWVAGNSVDGGKTFGDRWSVTAEFGVPTIVGEGPVTPVGEEVTGPPVMEADDESGLDRYPIAPESCWGTLEGSGKQGIYFGGRPGFRALPPDEYPFDVEAAPPSVSEFYPLREFTVSEISQIGYALRKPSGELDGSDIYLSIYTVPEEDGDDTAWYDSRLQALPAEANSGDPTFESGQFVFFGTGEAQNRLHFFDSGRSEIGPGETEIPKPNPANQATLAELGSGPVDWSTTDGTHDYSDETVLGLSLQTGSTESGDLEAYFDSVGVRLETGELLILDLGTTPRPV